MEVDPAFDKRWPKSLDARLFELLNRPLGYIGYRISSFGIRANLREVEDAISKYKFFFRHTGY
jgi:hypothetical protein